MCLRALARQQAAHFSRDVAANGALLTFPRGTGPANQVGPARNYSGPKKALVCPPGDTKPDVVANAYLRIPVAIG